MHPCEFVQVGTALFEHPGTPVAEQIPNGVEVPEELVVVDVPHIIEAVAPIICEHVTSSVQLNEVLFGQQIVPPLERHLTHAFVLDAHIGVAMFEHCVAVLLFIQDANGIEIPEEELVWQIGAAGAFDEQSAFLSQVVPLQQIVAPPDKHFIQP